MQKPLTPLHVDPELHQIVMSNMVHGPCGCINPNSPCMQDGRCSKKYPKQYITETQIGADSYPLYRRRNPDDGGQVSNISMRIGGTRVDQQIDNRWIVPLQQAAVAIYELPLQCRTLYVNQAHQVCTEVYTQRV